MYNKDALSALVSAIKANPDQNHASLDMAVLKETCLNACSLAVISGKCAVLRVFEGSGSDEINSVKDEKNTLIRRVAYNLAAANAMAKFYNADAIFAGSTETASDVITFCNEFNATLTKA